MHEIKQLADPGIPIGASPSKANTPNCTSPGTSDASAAGPSSQPANGTVFPQGSSVHVLTRQSTMNQDSYVNTHAGVFYVHTSKYDKSRAYQNGTSFYSP